MRLLDIKGNLVKKNVEKYRVDWDKKCRSSIQFYVKQFFRRYWQNLIVYEEFPVFGTLLKVDLINMTNKIAVETDGAQHDEFNPFFHNNSRLLYVKSIKRDFEKEEWLEKNGIKLIRIPEAEVKDISPSYFKDKFGDSLV